MKHALWVRSVRHYLLPQLPGDWGVSPKGILYRRPVQWLLNCVAMHDSRASSDFSNYKIVQLLPIPKRLLGGTQVSPPRLRTRSRNLAGTCQSRRRRARHDRHARTHQP